MRNKAEIRGRVGVAECCNSRGKVHKTCDSDAGFVAQGAVGIKHRAAAVAVDKAHVDVKARTGFAYDNLGCEGYIETFGHGLIADSPFGYHKLVGGIARGYVDSWRYLGFDRIIRYQSIWGGVKSFLRHTVLFNHF